VARVTIEDCLRRAKNRYMLVHAAAKRVRQMREGAEYLVHSPKNEDIVIALREIAAGRFSIDGTESEDLKEKRRLEMTKSERVKVTIKKTQTTARKATMKKSAPEKTVRKLASPEGPVRTAGIKKEYLEGGKLCKVTFRLPSVAAPDAKSVCIVGDFNNWNTHASPMKRQENGDYEISLKFEPRKEYQFRYLIDESRWENDWNADKYVKSPLGDSDNSVVVV
jgi:DNA-directed RNA polymerase omega subunit